jgi:hypothetical protein
MLNPRLVWSFLFHSNGETHFFKPQENKTKPETDKEDSKSKKKKVYLQSLQVWIGFEIE